MKKLTRKGAGLVSRWESRNETGGPRVHHFAFFNARKDHSRPLKPHQQRDRAAAMELLAALLRLGYDAGQPILNLPPATPPDELASDEVLYEVDRSFLRAGDLILQVTRPPIHDKEQGDKKTIERGYTDIEKLIFDRWKKYLSTCARSRVKLAERVRRCLPPGYENRALMSFRQNDMTGRYKQFNNLKTGWRQCESDEPRTALYFLRVDGLWDDGPGLLSGFGMDGISTYVWAYRLARDFSYLLSEPGFVLAEMETGDIPEHYTDFRWAMNWGIEILVRQNFERLVA